MPGDNLNGTDLNAYVARVLADAPALTDAKRDNITRLLRAGTRQAGDRR